MKVVLSLAPAHWKAKLATMTAKGFARDSSSSLVSHSASSGPNASVGEMTIDGARDAGCMPAKTRARLLAAPDGEDSKTP